MKRDIDYAATAVEKAIREKFPKQDELVGLEVVARDRTITVREGARAAEGTRDDLMMAINKSATYEQLWELLPIAP